MSNWKYQPLQTYEKTTKNDHTAFDFSSVSNYKSAFTYSGVRSGTRFSCEESKPGFFTNSCILLLTLLSGLFLFLTFPITGWKYLKVVQSYERIVIFRLGRIQPPKGPGMVFLLPFIDNWQRIDTRIRAFNVPPQQVFTADGALISLGANIYFCISDVTQSVIAVQDLNHAKRVLAQTAMLNMLTPKLLANIEGEKTFINSKLQEELNDVTQSWGVEVKRVELSHITILKQPNDQSLLGSTPNLMPPLANPLDFFTKMISQASLAPNVLPAEKPRETLITMETEMPPPPLETETSPVTMNEILTAINSILSESLVKSFGLVYKFELDGAGGETYYLDLKNGCGSVGRGQPPVGDQPDVSLATSTSVMAKLFTGELTPFQAYTRSLLNVKGDRTAAMKLGDLVKMLEDHPKILQ